MLRILRCVRSGALRALSALKSLLFCPASKLAFQKSIDFMVLKFFQNLQGRFTVQLSRCSGLSSERRRRDLNPRAAVNDLHPFQGCPFGQLGYFSRNTLARIISVIVLCGRITQPSPAKRRGWDSNPCALADKRFSRPPRYDHFDTSPER